MKANEMKATKMKSTWLNAEHLTAMCKALRNTGVFTVVRDSTSAIATHTSSGVEVLRALKKNSKTDLYLITHKYNLFA